jgi:hypothetical protein
VGTLDDILAAPAAPATASPPTSGGTLDSILDAPEPEAPSTLEAVGRGALEGGTFGFADEIAGALGAAFGNKKGTLGERYRQERDESRAKFEAARAAHPLAYLGGELGGGLVGAVGGGEIAGAAGKALGLGAEAVEGAQAAKTTGQLVAKGIGTGAVYGAAQGLGDSNADLTKGDFHNAIADTLTGAAAGGVAGGILEPVATKLLEGAPGRAAKDILNEIAAGEGTAGSATTTAKKLLASDKEDIIRTIGADHELGSAIGKPAKEALPVVNARLQSVGSQLDPLYQTVDKEAGGVSAMGLTDFLNNEAKTYGKTAFNEPYVKAVNDIRDSVLNTYAPALKTALMRDEKLGAMGVDVPQALRAQDVTIPTKDVRAMVTRLQSRAANVINPLNPGEAVIMKADMAGMMKRFLDAHLDAAAERAAETGDASVKAAVDNIRQINTTYSALSNIQKAVEQRAWKEATGSTSMGGHVSHLGTFVGGALGLSHGPVGMIAGAALASLGPKVARTLSHEGNRALAQLATASAEGAPVASLVAAAVKHGVPRDVAMRVVDTAVRIRNMGAQ